MSWSGISRKSLLVLVMGGLLLTPIVACGSAGESQAPSAPAAQPTAAASAQQPASQQSSSNQQSSAPAATQAPAQAQAAAPTAMPQAAGSGDTSMMAEPKDILSTGLKEMGPFFLHPSTLGNPQIFVHGTAPIGEGLLQERNREASGLLAESWSISDDFLTWTINLNKGIPFHKGYVPVRKICCPAYAPGFARANQSRSY